VDDDVGLPKEILKPAHPRIGLWRHMPSGLLPCFDSLSVSVVR
jgi:hypothetical protein